MIYRMLGQLVIADRGLTLTLPSGHRLIVLATLLINANKRVSTNDLLRAAWGTPDIDETQLHKCVSHLRSMLDTLGRRDDIKTLKRYGYELRVDEASLDKLQFEKLIRDAETAAAERRTDDEADLLRSALRLWTGPHPLAGVPGDSFRREAADLEQRRKRAAVRLFDLELGRGRHREILGELYTIVSYHPTDRRLCEQLMLALFHSGHATEALDAYNQHAAALREETGAEPEAGLRDLMYAIASADEQAISKYDASMRPVVVPRQLPSDPADFVGRDDPIAEVKWLLKGGPNTPTPVLVVTGPGGIGKTALAVHVAHLVRSRYPDGQLYVELHGTTAHPVATEEVLAQLLRALGVSNVPDTRDERAALYRSLLAERRVLLVLDDARDEAQIRDLVPGNAACGVLVTSRGRLPDIGGAHHLPTLQPLDIPSAIDLFSRVVGRSGVDPNAEPDATRLVVELCAGLPLALCVAGALRARDRDRSTADIAERLADQRLDGFVYGDRSVERSIGLGFDRLDADAQQLFLGLGLLQVPDFGLWTAAAVLDGTPTNPVDALLRLAGCHMIDPVGPGMRYRFHDLTREYARRRAESFYEAPARRVILERVYGALLTLARRAHWRLYTGDFEVVHGNTPAWQAPAAATAELDRSPMGWYEAERLTIRAAVRHSADLGLAELCWDLAVSAHEFYSVRGYLDDWHDTHLIARDACRVAGNLHGEAVVTAILGQPALAASRRAGIPGLRELSQAAAMLERLGDQHGQAIALRTLANGMRRRGQLGRALETFADALALYEASGDTLGCWQTRRYIGQTLLDLGDHAQALRLLTSVQQTARETGGDPRVQAQTANWIGQVHLARRDLDDARYNFQFVLDAVGATDDLGRAYANHGLGEVALVAGELTEAEERLTVASDMAHQIADGVLEGRVHRSLADLHRAHGRAEEEMAALDRAVACFASRNATYHQAGALAALGDACLRRGSADGARAAWTNAHALYSDMGLPDADRIRRHLEDLPV